jgi:hypothetical protein
LFSKSYFQRLQHGVSAQRSPSQVKGVGFRSLSRRSSWVRIPPSALFVACFFLDAEVGVCLAQLLLGGCVGVCFLCFRRVLVCILVVQVDINGII